MEKLAWYAGPSEITREGISPRGWSWFPSSPAPGTAGVPRGYARFIGWYLRQRHSIKSVETTRVCAHRPFACRRLPPSYADVRRVPTRPGAGSLHTPR
jgi:hypothetical protein